MGQVCLYIGTAQPGQICTQSAPNLQACSYRSQQVKTAEEMEILNRQACPHQSGGAISIAGLGF